MSSDEHGPKSRRAATLLKEALRDNLAYRRAPAVGVIAAVKRDMAAGPITSISVDLASGVQVDVPWQPGRGAPIGHPVELSYERRKEADPNFRFERFREGDRALPDDDEDMDIPPPTITAITPGVGAPTPGGQAMYVVVSILETPDRYSPDRVQVQYADDANAQAGIWNSVEVADSKGIQASQTVWLGWFPLRTNINVRARTWLTNGSRSPFTSLASVAGVDDNTLPDAPPPWDQVGPPRGPSVDATGHLTALFRLPDPSKPLVFDVWEIQVADTGGGANARSFFTPSRQYVYQVPAATTIYARVRERTRSGKVSAWSPPAAWYGPIVLQAIIAGGNDLTPPEVPLLATLTQAQEVTQGVMQVNLTATITRQDGTPYPIPADFSHVEWKVRDVGDPTLVMFPTTGPPTPTTLRVLGAPQARTLGVSARAFDIYGNASAWSNERTIATEQVRTPPGVINVTVTPGFRAAAIEWTGLADSITYGTIADYVVQRSNDGATVAATWYARVSRYVDAGSQLGIDTNYWYRVAARNTAGAIGPFSAWVIVRTKAVEDADFMANSIHANKLIAGTVDARAIGVGAVDAAQLKDGMILAQKRISVGPGGVIDAGGGNAQLDDAGVAIRGAGMLRVYGPSQFFGEIARAFLDGVDNFAGYGRAGALVRIQPDPAGAEAPLYISTQPAVFGTRYAVVLLGQSIHFRTTAGVPGWTYGFGGITRGDGSRGSTWTRRTPSAFLTLNGALPNTDVDVNVTDYAVPSGAAFVHIRGSVTAPNGANVYCHSIEPPVNIESGIYARGTGVAAHWGGLVPVYNDLIRFRGDQTFSATMVINAYAM